MYEFNNVIKKDLKLSLSKCRYAWKLMSDNYPNIYNEYLINKYPNEYVYNDSKAVFDYTNTNLITNHQLDYTLIDKTDKYITENSEVFNTWDSALLYNL